jgi:hypothetical protein
VSAWRGRKAVQPLLKQQLLGAADIPAEAAGHLLGIFAASRAGEFATADPTLASLIGREPSPLRTVLREQLAG